MRLAISGQLLGGTRSLPEILNVLGSVGVDAIEIWPHNLKGGETPEERQRYEHKDVDSARRLLEDNGMTIACLTHGFSAMRECLTGGPAVGAQGLKGTVAAAVALGARVINCYLGGINADLFIAAMRPAAEYAAAHGVRFALENEAHDDSGTAQGVRSIVEAVGSPYFGTTFDACNYYQANEEPYPYAYEVLKDLLFYAHAKGGSHYRPELRPRDHRGGTLRGSEDRHIGYCPIPDGAVNVDGIIDRLARDGYQGFVTLEPHAPPEQAENIYRIEVPYMRERLRLATALAAAP